ncbi:type II toxin-antitoxin system RelE/ParE family toxin [Persicimonas caeni]|uniref:Type II toxin-antitoxin system RelE/ParE family toxin n=1 Tax=Persicimonas caeni TaxID=2292766 RepID=A0A4Y6PRW2_PERCE|nr:type II toxin-antitoxin system RelE/ParE family toxin [Persicimonas caeni]QDG50970.1 type II toxin-antitoxin system RelE/ParE family toxin [Persicimonas caeni]QED32191.1 type II toxin-antitoxin system RelE/ParE family toxin [Persicimonas caeni]
MGDLTVKFDPRASRDLEAAVEWYDVHGDDLGDRFIDGLEELLDRLTSHPSLHAPVEGDVRRALIRQFPYAVYYLPKPNTIRVLAILHTSRRPDYWQSRDK